MLFTLKKLSTLAGQVNSILVGLKGARVDTILVDQFKATHEHVTRGREVYKDHLVQILEAIDAQYAIRKLIATENAKRGVNILLTDLAQSKFTLQQLKFMHVANFKEQSDAEIEAVFKYVQPSDQNSRYPQTMQISALTNEMNEVIDSSIRQLVKTINDINDQLTYINSAKDVDVPDDSNIVKFLKKNSLI